MTLEEVKKFLETDEAGKAWFTEEKEKEVEGLKSKNKLLLDKNAQYKKERDEAVNNAEELTEKMEELEDSKVKKSDDVEAALTKQREKHDKEIEKLTQSVESSTSTIRSLTIESALADSLAKSNISKDHYEMVKSWVKGQKIDIDNEDESPKALIGGSSISEFVEEFAKSDKGKLYVASENNSGGGATGGSGKGSVDLSGMSPTQKLDYARQQK